VHPLPPINAPTYFCNITSPPPPGHSSSHLSNLTALTLSTPFVATAFLQHGEAGVLAVGLQAGRDGAPAVLRGVEAGGVSPHF